MVFYYQTFFSSSNMFFIRLFLANTWGVTMLVSSQTAVKGGHGFTLLHQIHSYNTKLSAKNSYSLPKTRTNYGIVNIRYQGAKVWNELNESYKKCRFLDLNKNQSLIFLDEANLLFVSCFLLFYFSLFLYSLFI